MAGSAMTLAGSSLSAFAHTKSTDIGMQLYSMSKALSDDFTGTLEMLAETGYKNLEFAGPYYFSPEDEIKNNILIQQMGLKGY